MIWKCQTMVDCENFMTLWMVWKLKFKSIYKSSFRLLQHETKENGMDNDSLVKNSLIHFIETELWLQIIRCSFSHLWSHMCVVANGFIEIGEQKIYKNTRKVLIIEIKTHCISSRFTLVLFFGEHFIVFCLIFVSFLD